MLDSTRKWAHQWAHQWFFPKKDNVPKNDNHDYDVHCAICGITDMVDLCSRYHDADCKCVNPPCPPTQDELDAHVCKASETIAKAERDKLRAHTQIRAVVNLATAERLIQYIYGVKVPSTFRILAEEDDFLARCKTYRCVCLHHGEFTAHISMECLSMQCLYKRPDVGEFIIENLASGCGVCNSARAQQAMHGWAARLSERLSKLAANLNLSVDTQQ